jgi:hypothetical protein
VSDASPGSQTPTRRRPPRVSGKLAALWLALGLALAALLVPMVFRLPRWVDAEIVLAIWWVAWFAVLARFLYTGTRVTHDHEWRPPRNWFKGMGEPSPGSWLEGCLWFPAESEGCLIIVGLVAVFFLAWFVIEVAIPGLMLLVYAIARGMLAHVANDTHHCRGHLAKSVGWAAVWATLYTAPYAAAVWMVHWIHARA